MCATPNIRDREQGGAGAAAAARELQSHPVDDGYGTSRLGPRPTPQQRQPPRPPPPVTRVQVPQGTPPGSSAGSPACYRPPLAETQVRYHGLG